MIRSAVGLLLLMLTACGQSLSTSDPAVPDTTTSKIDTVPHSDIPQVHLDNVSAASAETMMEILSRGLKSYAGNPRADLTEKNVVWFEVPGMGKAFFRLPLEGESSWWPCPQKLPAKVESPGDAVPLGAGFLGHSRILADLRSMDIDVEDICRELRMGFRCREEGSIPNLYHFTVYYYRIAPEAWKGRLPNPDRPENPANHLLHKFDFLIGRH